MNVLINNTNLNVNNAYVERDTENGIISLFIIVPYSEMEYADLKSLCKSNTGDIIKIVDDTTETFGGFSYANISDDDEKEEYTLKLVSEEQMFQLGRNRQLESDNATLKNTVYSQSNEIATLNSTVTEKENTITELETTIAKLERQIESNPNDSGLLDDIADAIEEGVNEV